MLQVGDSLIINTDDEAEVEYAAGKDLIAISCGLRLNSTITASSISDDGFTYCLQRTIYTLSGRPIPPQEFNIKWLNKPNDLFPVLAVVTLLLLCDINYEIFKELRF